MFHTDHGQYREFIDRLFQVNIYLTNGISTEPLLLFPLVIRRFNWPISRRNCAHRALCEGTCVQSAFFA